MRYYSTQCPVIPGNYPKEGVVCICDQPNFYSEIGRSAWGFIDYDRELTPEGMRIWYGVVSSFYDTGRVAAAVTITAQAMQKPERRFISAKHKDVYLDWFDSKREAKQFAAEAENV